MNNRSVNLEEVPVVQLGVDIDCYKAASRKIRRVFRGTSRELVVMVLNFARFSELAVPMSTSFYSGSPLGYRKARAALDTLLKGGYVEPLRGFFHDATAGTGRCRTYRRTALFNQAFKLRLPDRLAVIHSALTSPSIRQETEEHNRSELNSISALATYDALIDGKKLSLRNGGQVFSDILLRRVDGKRLYAKGTYNYQGLSKKERPLLLIDGEPTVELDFKSMHGNLLLNREGLPSDGRFYEKVLGCLRLKVNEKHRKAVKPLVVASFNVKSVRGFGQACRRIVDRDDEERPRLIDILGVRPRQVSAAIVKAHPSLVNWVCTGKHWEWLQTADSEIMIDVLETLATMGIVGLPVHDSVIAPAKHADTLRRVVSDCYKRKMGFEPVIR
jgi:hypothetical protein